MTKVIWILWLQGWEEAPEVVRLCYQSWRQQNPGWEVRFLDAETLVDYLPTSETLDLLVGRQITKASFSDLVRVSLLGEYGGVWVDATLFCHRPLDSWLSKAMPNGVFAFSRPSPDRPIASWFLAAKEGNHLIAKYRDHVLAYWKNRTVADDYFWFHYTFRDLLLSDSTALEIWRTTPKISADNPHAILRHGVTVPIEDSNPMAVDTPVSKLTYRFEPPTHSVGQRGTPKTPLDHLREQVATKENYAPTRPEPSTNKGSVNFEGISLSTTNLGDHIQVLAAERLLKIYDVTINIRYDRDVDLDKIVVPTTLLIAGWFKHGKGAWPPSDAVDPIYLSFHIRTHQCPALVGEPALAHYRLHEPIGCRDTFTAGMLADHGVETFLSHCFTTTLPHRGLGPDSNQVYVVSRDETVLRYLPEAYKNHIYRCHYVGETDFTLNMEQAGALLDEYRQSASVVVTTLLHCALPCIAMGIPVIVCWPNNSGAGHKSDQERFSSLADLVPIYSLEDLSEARAIPSTAAMAQTKLNMREHLAKALKKRGITRPVMDSAFAPYAKLPVPRMDEIGADTIEAEARLRRLIDRGDHADVDRWSKPESYPADWHGREKMVAEWILPGSKILEIGAGAGRLPDILPKGAIYTGTDLAPIRPNILTCNVERDPLPAGNFDYVVALGVTEYIADLPTYAEKLAKSGNSIITSYCFAIDTTPANKAYRAKSGWVNMLDRATFLALFEPFGFVVADEKCYTQNTLIDQTLFLLSR